MMDEKYCLYCNCTTHSTTTPQFVWRDISENAIQCNAISATSEMKGRGTGNGKRGGN